MAIRFETTRAKVGATIMDVFRPGWADKIDLDALDMSSCEVCVLGQTYGGFDLGVAKLFAVRDTVTGAGGKYQAAEEAGFSLSGNCFDDTKYSRLTAAWKREITKRQTV